MNSSSTKGGDPPPSIRSMVRDLVELGVEAVQKRFQPAAPPATAKTESGPESEEIVFNRAMMVDSLVVDGQICLLTPPNETVYGFLCCEIWTPPGKSVDGCDLDVQSADAVDSQGIQSSMSVPLIKKGLGGTVDTGLGHLCRLKHHILIGPQDYIGLRYGQSLPPGTKLIGYALGAIHPRSMGGALGTPAPRPRDPYEQR